MVDVDLKQNKQTFLETIDQSIREWRDGVKEMNKKAESQSEEAKDQVKAEINNTEKKIDELRQKLDKLKEKGEGEWPELTQEVSHSYNDVKESYQALSEKVN